MGPCEAFDSAFWSNSFLVFYIVSQYMLSCFSTTMSSMPVLDGEPEEMEIEIEIPLEEVSVSHILVLL